MRLPVVLALFPLALSVPADAKTAEDKPQITAVQVSLDGRRVAVGFELQNGVSDPLFERIETGLPSGFTYEIQLSLDRKRWWDRRLASAQLQVEAVYDAVTQEYLVNFQLDGKLIDSRITRDRQELEGAMSRVDSLSVFTIGEVDPKRRVQVRVRADLGSKTRFGIIPTRVTTDWALSEKFHPPAG